jgi:arylsulfatase
MDADRTEMHNLASRHPEKVDELSRKWTAWAKRAHVLPLPGSKKKAKKK